MQLSRLEVFGFKSFAQKATFKFDEGLTGVIGPNGCGKSNIVDAIRWVLGEQRARVLRCERMENLIFNGTKTRKPLGMAEVSLYIDNNRNVLPSDYTEIKLTRRLYRSGESEYLMNNEMVRLMDITNLFADTGMGADAYSVIELKMVEQILSDNADERRRLFEEAAGIKKFKARRRSALLKLETTEQELTRLDDILSEVQKAVNSLARQVGKARRYHEFKQQLKEKELLLIHLKLYSYEHELLPLRSERDEVSKTREVLGKEVITKEAELEKLQSQAVALEQDFRRAAGELHVKDESIQELQSRGQLRKQRIDSLEETIEAYEKEIIAQETRREQLTQEQGILRQQLEENQKAGNTAQEAYRGSANQQLEAESGFQKARGDYQSFIQANVQELQQGGELKEAFQRIQIEKGNCSERTIKVEASLEKIEETLQAKRIAMDKSAGQLEELQEEVAQYHKEQEHLAGKLQGLKEEQNRHRNEVILKAGKLEKLKNQRDFLENLIDNYEGFSQSVQYVMSNKAQYSGVVDTLANLVDCAPEYQTALESYLKEISHYLVVREVDTAWEIFSKLRSERKGRLTLVPLSLVAGNKHITNGKVPASGNGAVSLKEVVSYPAEYEDVFGFLFRETYLVKDLQAAINMRAEFPHLTYITREGDILEHWGNVTGGAEANESGIIGRKEKYRRLLENQEKLQKDLNNDQSRLDEIESEISRREGKLTEFAELLVAASRQTVEAEKEHSRLAYEVERLSESTGELTLEKQNIEEKLYSLVNEEKKLLPEIKVLEDKSAAYQNQEQGLLAAQAVAEEALRAITREMQERQISYLNLTSREKELTQRLNFIDQGLRDAEQFVLDRKKRIEENRGQIKSLEEENKEIGARLETLNKERDVLDTRKNAIEVHLQEHQSAIQLSEAELKKRQRLWNQARERIQELELRIREMEVKLSTVREQALEKYGEGALEFDINALDPSIAIADVQNSIHSIRQRLEGLGDVNPLAIKEHEKEKERLDFLNSQRDDLLSARDQLLETIDKLNTTARRQFMETFEEIQVNFQKVFQEFFEGGEAKLRLVEKNDPLEASIEFSLLHKGKQMSALSLLSAGEKTLTAISLLFAIYLVKPSPFCILDEVDAPLDDVNISRLAKALEQFSSETQFILVTHNKKTMEATNALYGVTMEELGVSKVVSVRFD